MDLRPGATLEHYRIVDKIGEGGMGVVWRAVDTTLEREVAIKLLPPSYAADAERLARFEREARVLASLNHPNIAAIHGLHRSGEAHFLTMELVPGEDLARRIEGGALPLDQALKVARQLADALATAHRAGVIHRDLKPANVRITPGNQVKVLDFGLAKALAAGGAVEPDAAADPARSPTVASLGTVAGMILGTAAYMAPEQARGRPVDHRADIWAFGVVLYEMLTGRRLFSGETTTDTLALVLTQEPDLDAVPAPARRLVRACLRRDPEERLRDIGDAMLLVDDDPGDGDAAAGTAALAAGAGASTVGSRVSTSAGRLGAGSWLLAAAALALGLVVGLFVFGDLQSEPPATPLRFLEQPPAGGRFLRAPVPSPDGRHLAMVVEAPGQRGIWVRSLEDDTARLIVSGASAALNRFVGAPSRVRWSPDSSELVYSDGNTIRRVRRDGTLDRVVISSQLFTDIVWGPGDELYVSSMERGLQRLSIDGGPPTTLLVTQGAVFRSIDLATPGPRVLLQQFGASNGIYTTDADGSNQRALLPSANSSVRFLPPDHILYVENRVLLAQRVDPASMALIGEAQPIATDVEINGFETSAAGMISFVSGAERSSTLTRFDRTGNVIGTSGAPAEYEMMVLSPDGTQLMFSASDPASGNIDLWLQDIDGGAPLRFSTSPDTDHLPAWSPDGTEVVWEAHAGSDLVLMRRPTDMSTPPELVREWNRGGGPQAWSPNGNFILYTSDDGDTRENLWAVPLDGTDPQPLIETEATDELGRFSPDGGWLAYTSDVSGRREIYLQRIDGMQRIGAPQRVSADGGVKPLWRADGHELFFLQGTTLMAVDVDVNDPRPAGAPRTLFDIGERTPYYDYVVAPDGQSFMAIVQPEQTAPAAATVILNWTGR